MIRFIFILFLFPISSSSSSSLPPNIVLFITDDQDSQIGGLTPMKSVDKLLTKRGTTFVNSFVASPICCPSRASILTGTHVHNHQTYNNSRTGGCDSQNWRQNHETKTFAALLHSLGGYSTFYAGKYLNEYGKGKNGPSHVPPGWSEWRGLVGNSVYFNFTLSKNGTPILYNKGEYLTDVIKDEALSFIDAQRANGFKQPFLVVAAPPAPHAPFTPAKRHEDTFKNVNALRTPSFNIPVGEDKHWLLRMPPSPLPNATVEKLDSIYRSRWQTLLAVDEMVEAVVKRLEAYKIIDNTFIIFTSDNGYHVGQFSQPFDKRQPYETDIRVPLIIRGPHVESQVQKLHPTVNVDLAPTLLKIARLEIPDHMDGLPLPILEETTATSLPEPSIETNFITPPENYDRQMLIEYFGEASEKSSSGCPWSYDLNLTNCISDFSCKCQDSKNNTYGCVRHLNPMMDTIYCLFNDYEEFEEAYDLSDDPHQLKNVIGDMMPAIKFKYQNALEHLSKCVGSSCHTYAEYSN